MSITPDLECRLMTTSPMRMDQAYAVADGRTVRLPGGVVSAPALSPDGRTAGFIRALGPSPGEGAPPTEVILMDIKTRRQRIVIQGAPDVPFVRPETYLRSETRVTFSANGKRLYVEAACPCDSDMVHEVNIATGARRFIAAGVEISVLRDGPWRGDLLMGVHTCYRRHAGCDYPVHVVRRDGATVYVVPRTEGAHSQQVVARWLKARHWRAW
jgi:hypothetical protein